jgi:hypothetical protein
MTTTVIPALAAASGGSDHRMKSLPYLLPWVRVLLLIRSITSTTWGATRRGRR